MHKYQEASISQQCSDKVHAAYLIVLVSVIGVSILDARWKEMKEVMQFINNAPPSSCQLSPIWPTFTGQMTYFYSADPQPASFMMALTQLERLASQLHFIWSQARNFLLLFLYFTYKMHHFMIKCRNKTCHSWLLLISLTHAAPPPLIPSILTSTGRLAIQYFQHQHNRIYSYI